MRGQARSLFERITLAAGHAALAGLVVGLYVWTSVSGRPTDFSPGNKGYYGRLSEAFLAGRTYFADPPPPELLTLKDPYDPAGRGPRFAAAPNYLHDASYYKGRYYLYFGPVPALVLGAPFKLVTGLDFNEYLMPMVFCAGAYVLGLLILLRLRRALAPRAPDLAVLTACLVYGLCGTQLFMLRRPSVYEVSIAAGVFFALAAVLALLPVVLGAVSARRKLAGMALAGICLALAAGSRHSYVLSLPVVVVVLWIASRPSQRPDQADAPGRTAMVAAFVLPAAALIGCLLAYNYVRFDSFLCTGHGYQLTSLKADTYEFVSPRFVPANLYLNLFLPLRRQAEFPYFQAETGPPDWLRLPAGYIGGESIMGALTNIPVLLMFFPGLILVLSGRVPLGRRGAAALALIAVPGSVNLALVLCYSHATMRYLVDFLPFFMLLSAIFFLMAASRLNARPTARFWLFVLAAPLAALSLTTNAATSLDGYLGDFRVDNPAAYTAIERKVEELTSLFSPGNTSR